MGRPTGVEPGTSSGVRLAEVVAAIALASDLGLGQPLDHVLRSCVIATRLGEHLDLDEEDQDATYWATLFLTAGCIGTSFELSKIFGDDIAFRAGMYELKGSDLEFVRFLFGRAGGDRGLAGRTKVRFDLVRTRMAELELSFLAHCAVSMRMAERLGLGDRVVDSLGQTFAQWDGKGLPKGVGGDDLLVPIQIANLANMVEVWHRDHGIEEAVARSGKAEGTMFAPELIAAWTAGAAEVLDGVDEVSSWDAVVGAEPAGRGPLTEAELDEAIELLADLADLKSPWLVGHSRGVASLAVAAAEQVGLPEGDLVTLRRAALLHDLGRVGVPNSIWDKQGGLSDGEREKVRLHAYYTDRVLHRAGRLSGLAAVASAAHERADGTGYPRSIAGGTIPLLGRILEAADVYHAMIEDRPHRPAVGRDEAASELRRSARAGELEGAAVDAVLAAAGHAVRRKPTTPAGLTPREVEVLALVARGGTTKAAAAALGIAPKTAGNHIERIYTKIGVSTRAEAAMYAMQHGLVPNWDTDVGET